MSRYCTTTAAKSAVLVKFNAFFNSLLRCCTSRGCPLQVDSLDDMRRFVMEHSDFQMLQGNVSKHVNLVSALSGIISKRNLMELSQVRVRACVGGVGGIARWLHIKPVHAMHAMHTPSTR